MDNHSLKTLRQELYNEREIYDACVEDIDYHVRMLAMKKTHKEESLRHIEDLEHSIRELEAKITTEG